MFISCTQCFVLHIVKFTHQQGDMFTKLFENNRSGGGVGEGITSV